MNWNGESSCQQDDTAIQKARKDVYLKDWNERRIFDESIVQDALRDSWNFEEFAENVRQKLLEAGEKNSDGEGYCSSLDPKYMKSMTTQRDKMRQKGDKVSLANMIAWIDNTVLKMAIKRAYMDMILRATGASRIFMQEAEDMYDVIDGEGPPDSEIAHHNQSTAIAGQKSTGNDEREMPTKQKDRIMEGLEGKLKKYGPLFVEYYGQKEPLFNAKVKPNDRRFELYPTTVPEANTTLRSVIWLDSEADTDFQAWLKKKKAVITP